MVSAEGFNDQVCAPGWPNHRHRHRHQRTAGGAFRCSNDGVSKAVAQWLAEVRAATSPGTVVVVVVPFGGEMRTRNLTRA